MSDRSIRVHTEKVGEPRKTDFQTEQDTIQFDVQYCKGYGYKLVGNVVQDLGEGTFSHLLATGISFRESVAPARRFSKTKLEDCATLVRMNGHLERAVKVVKDELRELGQLGKLLWLRCRDCGWDQHVEIFDEEGEESGEE